MTRAEILLARLLANGARVVTTWNSKAPAAINEMGPGYLALEVRSTTMLELSEEDADYLESIHKSSTPFGK